VFCLPLLAELSEVSIYVWINNPAGIPYRTFMIALISFNFWRCSFQVSRSVQCWAMLCRVQESLRDLVVMLCGWCFWRVVQLILRRTSYVYCTMFRRSTIELWGPVSGIGRSAWVPALAMERYIRADKMVFDSHISK
jgi:hypothetical protein